MSTIKKYCNESAPKSEEEVVSSWIHCRAWIVRRYPAVSDLFRCEYARRLWCTDTEVLKTYGSPKYTAYFGSEDVRPNGVVVLCRCDHEHSKEVGCANCTFNIEAHSVFFRR
jgi:hypothetical protein